MVIPKRPSGRTGPAILLHARPSSDLAACGHRNRTRRNHNEIRDAKTVRRRNPQRDLAFDARELVHRILVGVYAVLEFDDGDRLLGALVRNRYRDAAAPGEPLDRRIYGRACYAYTRLRDP